MHGLLAQHVAACHRHPHLEAADDLAQSENGKVVSNNLHMPAAACLSSIIRQQVVQPLPHHGSPNTLAGTTIRTVACTKTGVQGCQQAEVRWTAHYHEQN